MIDPARLPVEHRVGTPPPTAALLGTLATPDLTRDDIERLPRPAETPGESPRGSAGDGRRAERLTRGRVGSLPPKVLNAVAWLLRALDPLPCLVVDLQVAATTAHVSWPAVRRAKLQAGILARRRDGRWYWERPAVSARPAVDRQLGLTQRPIGSVADYPGGTRVQLASGSWARIVEPGACAVTIYEPGRGTREVAPGTEVFAVAEPEG
jgi:hypothetical protein